MGVSSNYRQSNVSEQYHISSVLPASIIFFQSSNQAHVFQTDFNEHKKYVSWSSLKFPHTIQISRKTERVTTIKVQKFQVKNSLLLSDFNEN